MSTITRELAKLFRKITNSEIDAEGNAHVVLSPADSLLINNARIALASLEAEPVAWAHRLINKRNGVVHPWVYGSAEACPSEGDIFNIEVMPLYTAPPAPVSVPAAMEIDDDFDSAFEHGKAVGWNAYRAAMLQGADVSLTHEGKNHHEDKLGMVNHLGDVTEKVEPVTQIEPVADLYGLTSPTGGETSFTFDAVEARDFIDGGWSCQEYVELERFQEAVSGNSPVIQDGWVAVPVEPTIAILDEFDSIIDYGAEDSKDAWSRLLAAAWIKSLPAAPQQEVESQIRKGKTVAREEWELGARLTKHRFKP